MGSRRHTDAQRPAHGRVALVLALVLSTTPGCELVYQLQQTTIFPVEQLQGPVARPTVEGSESWWLDVEGGRVEAIYLPALRPEHGPQRPEMGGPAVIFAHGHTERIGDYLETFTPYREMGFAVLLPEYRGYGASSGVPSEAAIVADFVHFFDRLSDRPEVDGARIVFHGRSLGGGVVAALARERRPAAMILESTFTNMPDLASRWFAPMGVVRDRFDTLDVLERSSTPTLILHGVNDDVIPFQHAVELDRVAWDSRLIVYRAGHNDLPRSQRAYFGPIREFLAAAGVSPR